MKIKVTQYGVIHYIAQCAVCDWNCAIMTDEAQTPENVRTRVREHVKETSHHVNIESGTSTHYSADCD